jgi:hypothetical protein
MRASVHTPLPGIKDVSALDFGKRLDVSLRNPAIVVDQRSVDVADNQTDNRFVVWP